jgi:Raf kinase inhibitor-like YbhB/YbcL family protein
MKKFLFCSFVLSLAACTAQATPASMPTSVAASITAVSTEVSVVQFELSSSAFENGEAIPPDFSCDGKDTSPTLMWTEPPAGTQSFALIMDDPDAPMGTWVHWVLYNIPASTRELGEAISADPKLEDGSVQGYTSAKTTGYHGPCPPFGTHRYFFKLYALDTMLTLSEKAGKNDVLSAMDGHILANAELMGTFSH